ncbi:hypothetical protein A7985_11315 [Pseudoalteromonas luteoviolacea]|uniref:Uncharacterized protein n=1 Tax=Pseudoalteromonas luteoviolacea TaxID=43657 RepID=A0A1C0TQK0_9GAMM|nr:hypothetical protein A7985_11315 [Pseudoalteromonas luteoviolacea]
MVHSTSNPMAIVHIRMKVTFSLFFDQKSAELKRNLSKSFLIRLDSGIRGVNECAHPPPFL